MLFLVSGGHILLKVVSLCSNGNGSSTAARQEHNTRQGSGAQASFSGRPDQLTCRLVIDCMVSLSSPAFANPHSALPFRSGMICLALHSKHAHVGP